MAGASRTKSKTDRVEKSILMHAPRSRVRRALTDAKEFGQWFRVKLEGPFVAGALVRGRLQIPGFKHKIEIQVERIEPETDFAYRWHPYAVDPKVDYSKEPTTLVEFRLEDEGKKTRVTVVESGFDGIPLARRAEAFRMHEGGWEEQMGNLEQYVAPGK